MIFKNYYKILGLETNKVSIDEIKIAFREQAKKYHPDVSKDEKSEERFKDINEAYKVLTNPSSKRKYDRIWYSHVGKKLEKKDEKGREKKVNFLHILFGKEQEKIESKKKKVPKKGENIETQVEISLEEAFYGTNKKIALRTTDGKMKNFSVTIPAGIQSEEKIRLLGQGKPGENGAKSGDLLIKAIIQNSKKLKLEGYDISTKLDIAPWEAVLGKKVSVETIDDTVNVYIPQGVQTGETIKIPQKGYKDGKGGRGNLIAEIRIMVPKQPTEEEIELFKKLNKISKFEPRKEILEVTKTKKAEK